VTEVTATKVTATDVTQTAYTMPLAAGWSVWRLAALRSAGMPFDWLDRFADAGEGARVPDRDAAAVRSVLAEDRFLAALSWQNPAVVSNWAGRHSAAARAGESPRCGGKRAAAVARYVQRYCAKNDTIGHFGPVAWARLDGTHPAIVRTGDGGIRRRTVYLEPWVVAALAARWATDPELRTHQPVRMHPAAWFDGDGPRLPWRGAPPLTELGYAVLRSVRAAGPPRCIGDVAAEASATCGEAADEALAELDRLEKAGVVAIGFRVPVDEDPGRHVRAQLAHVPDAGVRARLLAQLDELEVRRAAVAAVPDDPSRAHRALRELSATVERLTGGTGTRVKDVAATGRTPAYLDCRADLDVSVGADLVDRLYRPLGIVLDTARYLAAEAADAVAAQLRRRYAELLRDRSPVRLSELYFSVADVLAGRPGTPIDEVVRDFQLRWAELLPSGADDVVTLSSADVATRAAALFPYRSARWQGARYHSPDVMLRAAPDGPRWVLGELHVALNTLESRVFHTQSDDPSWLTRAVAADLTGERIVALPPVDSVEVSPRTYPPLSVHVPARYRYWSTGLDAGAPGGAPTWPAVALTVHADGAGLVVRAPDGAWEAPILEVIGDMLTALVVDRFQITAPRVAAPRIVLDDLVIQRRSWCVPAADLVRDARHAARLGAELAGRGLPRHVFARGAAEPKPYYVDLTAPLLVRNLIRSARLAARRTGERAHIRLTEMLPGPDDLWLTGAAGERYTSEFRLVAVDDAAGRTAR
jgi:hypothetical protein